MFTSVDLVNGDRTRQGDISALSARSNDPTISPDAVNNLVTSSKRKGKFFGITTTGGAGNNLQVIDALKKNFLRLINTIIFRIFQLGLSFIGTHTNL